MAVIVNGWFDWAIRTPGPDRKQNGGVNLALGIFLHSAEGGDDGVLNLAVNGPLSWHLSNLADGTLHQHYRLQAQCWHASAANNNYVGMEHSGTFAADPTLSEGQVSTAVRVIEELAEWRGWTPKRPTSRTDTSHTLWEHNEVVRLGGTATACPSGRIPWDEILRRLSMPEPAERQWLYGNEAAGEEVVGNQIFIWHLGIVINKIGDEAGLLPGRRLHNEGGVFVEKEP